MITCHNVFNVCPKTTVFLPTWPEMPKGWTPLELRERKGEGREVGRERKRERDRGKH